MEILVDSTNPTDLDRALRKLKKAMDPLLKDIKRHEFHVGPGERRRFKSLAARRRARRIAAKKAQRAAWREGR